MCAQCQSPGTPILSSHCASSCRIGLAGTTGAESKTLTRSYLSTLYSVVQLFFQEFEISPRPMFELAPFYFEGYV